MLMMAKIPSPSLVGVLSGILLVFLLLIILLQNLHHILLFVIVRMATTKLTDKDDVEFPTTTTTTTTTTTPEEEEHEHEKKNDQCSDGTRQATTDEEQSASESSPLIKNSRNEKQQTRHHHRRGEWLNSKINTASQGKLSEEHGENEKVGEEAYYYIEYLDDTTIAISEPRYWQQNISYLLIGSERALLLDVGPGIRNIFQDVVTKLVPTNLPIIVMITHWHWDHTGGLNYLFLTSSSELPKDITLYLGSNQIDPTAACFCGPSQQQKNNKDDDDDDDDDGLEENEQRKLLKPFDSNFFVRMACRENITSPKIPKGCYTVVQDGEMIELGGDRTVQILITPGHSKDSISVLDPSRHRAYLGDFIWGEIVATDKLLVHSSAIEYQSSSKKLLTAMIQQAKSGISVSESPPVTPSSSTNKSNRQHKGDDDEEENQCSNNAWKLYVAHNDRPIATPYRCQDLKDIISFFDNKGNPYCCRVSSLQLGTINDRIQVIY